MEPGDTGQYPVTKIGGVPWWPRGLGRPRCPHGHAMSFIAQVLLHDVPELGPDDRGLLSFHYCQDCTYKGTASNGWPEPAEDQSFDLTIFNDWADQQPDGLGITAEDVLGPHSVAFSDRYETPDLDAVDEIGELSPLLHQIPFDDEEIEFLLQDAYGFDESKFPDLVHIPVSKLGGWPSWVQYPEWPLDEPEEKIVFVGQLSPMEECKEYWCNGLAYLFVSPNSVTPRKTKLLLQYT